jgi:hypothetical protein
VCNPRASAGVLHDCAVFAPDRAHLGGGVNGRDLEHLVGKGQYWNIILE